MRVSPVMYNRMSAGPAVMSDPLDQNSRRLPITGGSAMVSAAGACRPGMAVIRTRPPLWAT
jgi:hypothetical protein